MGIYVYYEGTILSSGKLDELLSYVMEFSKSHNWRFENYNRDTKKGIIVFAYEKCEPFGIVFDQNLKMNGSFNITLAPEEIYLEIVKLFYSLKHYFKRLKVHDDCGVWDSYINSFKAKTNALNLEVKKLTEDQLNELRVGFVTDKLSNAEEEWFWENEFTSGNDCCVVILRDLMRKDLSSNYESNKYIRIADFPNMLKCQKINLCGIYHEAPELTIVDLAMIWYLHMCELNGVKVSVNKAISFGFIISRACFGFGGGYITSFHRDMEKLLDNIISTTLNIDDPEVTLGLFYGILETYKLKRIKN